MMWVGSLTRVYIPGRSLTGSMPFSLVMEASSYVFFAMVLAVVALLQAPFYIGIIPTPILAQLEVRSMNDSAQPDMLRDPYGSWIKDEGVPVVEDFGIDLLQLPVKPWARFGVDGGVAHLKGRGDFVAVFVLDLAPGAKSEPQRHLYEEVVYVLSGHGSTTIETADGRKHSFEWGPKSLFALPLNARYRHFNASGRERARLASTNNLPIVMNLFHNEAFIFDNP